MYEYLDTRYGITGSALAPRNFGFRVMVRGGYLALNTFVAALLPFLGDFMSLTGAISTFPLTFILANHMYLKAKKNKLISAQKLWHWLNVCFFGLMAVAAAIASLRLIAADSKTYHVFADLWLMIFERIPLPSPFPSLPSQVACCSFLVSFIILEMYHGLILLWNNRVEKLSGNVQIGNIPFQKPTDTKWISDDGGFSFTIWT